VAITLVNIGFGNVVVASRVVAVVHPGSSPARRLKDDAKESGRLVDATQGRRTRSIIVTDSNHVILSSVQGETISQRLAAHPAGGESE
jgi:extracellular matrix regulatory protein A